ncbi:MAG: oxygenase MpaB family protein, partial [Pseudomonadota bacterium]
MDREGLEAGLAALDAHIRDPVAGVFGPGSATWDINREAVVFLAAGRAALLQTAHPWVAAAITRQSQTLTNPLGRFHGTFIRVFRMVFGSRDQAFAEARALFRVHARIRGPLPQDAGEGESGTYTANHRPAMAWVLATLVESALLIVEQVR